MKFSTCLLSVVIVFSSVSMHGMKQFKKTSQLLFQRNIKNKEKTTGLNFRKHLGTLELKHNNQFKSLSRLDNIAFEADIESKPHSKKLISAIKKDNGYKGLNRNGVFCLYNTTKRNFHSNRQAQGPLFGWFMYGATKTVLYAIPLAAAGATIISAPPVAASLATKAGAAAGAAGLTLLTAEVSAPIAATAAAIATDAALTTAAVTTTAATTAATGGCAAAYITFVEGCAAAVGALCGMTPIP